jgi:predicted nucleic acid-binding protein
MDLIADTTFLVGLWRGQSWATHFAKSNPETRLGLPWVVLGEFWHGAIRAGHDTATVSEFLALGIPILEAEPAIQSYARLCASLQDTSAYRQIGQNDLWIAAVCLSQSMPLVTRNARHFDQIKGLRIQVIG